jgi:hypothetical protein
MSSPRLFCVPAEVPKGIEAETFKQLSRENAPPGPPMGGRGPRGGGAGGGGGFGGEERWQSGRMPSGPIPGPPGMRGDPRMMGRQASGRHKGGECHVRLACMQAAAHLSGAALN